MADETTSENTPPSQINTEQDKNHPATNVEQNLIAILQKRGVLDEEQAEQANQSTLQRQESLEQHLQQTYGVPSHEICLAMAEHASVPTLRVANWSVNRDLLENFSVETLKNYKALPLARNKKTLTVALADPLDVVAVEEFANATDLRVIPVAAPESEIGDILTHIEEEETQDELGQALEQMSDGDIEMASQGSSGDEADIAEMTEEAEEATVKRIVNMMILEALNRGSSDIHIEAFEKRVRLRFRTDGQLEEGPAPPKHLQNAIISRVKIMADLDIAEHRVPLDGKFKIKAQGKDIDFRVSTLPMVHGEKICLRLLDKSNLKANLDELGLDPQSLSRLRYAINQPHGMVLVTGPTGSGKTTTLYSALQEINTVDVNITTTENPVEYQLEGINQVQINPDMGLTFAGALRSILRQDPDVVLVGETRDKETATIAVEAALTGHLVFTTLHTNDAPSAITRLEYMGVEPFLLASSVLLSQAQRLVRRICSNCKKEVNIRDELTEEYIEENRIPMEIFEDGKAAIGEGCSRCGDGYKGRTSVMEVLLIDSDLRQLILQQAEAEKIKQKAMEEKDFRDLRTSGFYRVKERVTTFEEIVLATTGE